MNLIKHTSPESIIAAFWHFDENDMTIEDYLKSEGVGYTEEGEEVALTGADNLEAIKENGFWGFADPKTKDVHVWIGDGADPEEIIFFLGHELGHLSGTPAPETGDEFQDHAAEEERADGYGEVAQQAYKWLKELLP